MFRAVLSKRRQTYCFQCKRKSSSAATARGSTLASLRAFVYARRAHDEAGSSLLRIGKRKGALSMQDFGKLTRRLEIMRAAGAISDFRLMRTPGRALIEVQPGDSLDGAELHDFVSEMMGSDREHVQIVVVAEMK